MAIVSSSGFAHVRLTVTDIHRSKAFYDQIFGWPVAADQSALVNESGVRESAEKIFGGTVYQMPSGALLGLRPVAPGGQQFDSDHTGLDHLSFRVESRADLVAAESRLSDADVEHGEIMDLTDFGMAILSFQDPDGVNLELTAML